MWKVKRLLVLTTLLQFSIFTIYAQIEIGDYEDYVDPRDNNTYQIIQIDNKVWFADNLKFETNSSHCPNFNRRKKDCKQANFYTYQELNKVCPTNWHVSTKLEWDAYMEYYYQHQEVDTFAFKVELHTNPYHSFWLSDTSEILNLYVDNNLLKLAPLGWVQGSKRKKMKTITFWVDFPQLNDQKLHYHIGASGYVRHSHKHHIIDEKKRKNRKFAVRCVRDVE